MKVVFISNYMNHHQLPFSLEMVKRLGDGYRFIATMPIEQERITLGYEDMNHAFPFIIRPYEDAFQKEQTESLIMESDIVIQGGSNTELIDKRLRDTSKVTIRYMERFFKKGYYRLLDPRVVKQAYLYHSRYNSNPNFYVLCAGGYVARDCQIIHSYTGRMFKWGYFPEMKMYENISNIIAAKEKNSLMWAGRFIDWKHSEQAIKIAKRLKRNKIEFKLSMLGTGPLLEKMKAKVIEWDLTDVVTFYGAISPNEVRTIMEKTSIYLFTSDYNEGWGAVLNEAMNSGCAVVASHAIGAVPFLVIDGKNGLIYKNKSISDAYSKVKLLLDNDTFCQEIGKSAYYTIKNTWNHEIAATRLIGFCDGILQKKDVNAMYVEGPCSPAKVIPQHAQYNEMKRDKK